MYLCLDCLPILSTVKHAVWVSVSLRSHCRRRRFGALPRHIEKTCRRHSDRVHDALPVLSDTACASPATAKFRLQPFSPGCLLFGGLGATRDWKLGVQGPECRPQLRQDWAPKHAATEASTSWHLQQRLRRPSQPAESVSCKSRRHCRRCSRQVVRGAADASSQ